MDLAFDDMHGEWSAGFGTILQVSALASHWLESCASCRLKPKENDNKAPITLSSSKPIHFYRFTIILHACD
jgi:hypothetical protein